MTWKILKGISQEILKPYMYDLGEVLILEYQTIEAFKNTKY